MQQDNVYRNISVLPTNPSQISLSNVDNSSIKASWLTPTNSEKSVSSYNVYVKKSSESTFKLFGNTTSTTLNITGLLSNTSYDIAITSVSIYTENCSFTSKNTRTRTCKLPIYITSDFRTINGLTPYNQATAIGYSVFLSNDLKVWRCIKTFNYTNESCYSCAVNDNAIIIGTGSNYIYVSTDMGNTWITKTFDSIMSSCYHIINFYGKFVMMGHTSNNMGAYGFSSDGITWDLHYVTGSYDTIAYNIFYYGFDSYAFHMNLGFASDTNYIANFGRDCTATGSVPVYASRMDMSKGCWYGFNKNTVFGKVWYEVLGVYATTYALNSATQLSTYNTCNTYFLDFPYSTASTIGSSSIIETRVAFFKGYYYVSYVVKNIYTGTPSITYYNVVCLRRDMMNKDATWEILYIKETDTTYVPVELIVDGADSSSTISISTGSTYGLTYGSNGSYFLQLCTSDSSFNKYTVDGINFINGLIQTNVYAGNTYPIQIVNGYIITYDKVYDSYNKLVLSKNTDTNYFSLKKSIISGYTSAYDPFNYTYSNCEPSDELLV